MNLVKDFYRHEEALRRLIRELSLAPDARDRRRAPKSTSVASPAPTENKRMRRVSKAGMTGEGPECLLEARGESSAAERSGHEAHDSRLLFLGDVGGDGEGEYFTRKALGGRKLSFAVSEVREARLKMEWDRVVDLSAHTCPLQLCANSIPGPRLREADDVLMKDVLWGLSYR